MKLFKQILFKILPILVCILFFSKESKANHVKGGEVFYTYLGPGINPNTSSYLVSLRLFRDCNQPCGGITGVACLPLKVTISIFENSAGYNRILDKSVTRTSITPITLTTYPPCITIKPAVCYEIGLYTFKVELIDNQVGYRFVFQTCCRDEALNELQNANTASFYPGDRKSVV